MNLIDKWRGGLGGINPWAVVPVALLALVAIFAPQIGGHDPSQIVGDSLEGISPAHWLGTDDLGRDLFARLVWAARTSLSAMAIVLVAALAIGVVVGSIAGFVGGWVDLALISVIDIMLALPSLVIALALIGTLGAGPGSMIAALTLAWWANYARMSRAMVAGEVHQPHIEAARVIGAGRGWVFVRHILPSVLGVVLVYASADAGALVLAIATLSFLGLGVSPPTAEWGQMLVDGMNFLDEAPALVLLPGLALTLVVVSFNVLGEAIALQKLPRPLRGRALRRRQREREVAEAGWADTSLPDMRGSESNDAPPLYTVESLRVDLYTERDTIRAVDGCSIAVRPGETLAIVGESGSGKTVLTLGPLGLLPEGVSAELRGQAHIGGATLIGVSERLRARLRASRFGVVFQDPLSALNPMRRIGPQLAEQARRGSGLTRRAAREEAVTQLRRVGIADPEDRYGRYPHELSGGMRQRAMIALALAARPAILLADEPTTALDATVQAQILALLKRLQREDGLAVVLITHDIGVVAGMADRVAVMYAGRIVEEGSVAQVLNHPTHPYTQGLLAAVPDLATPIGARLREIAGTPANLATLAPGCRFAERCAAARPSCGVDRPVLTPVSPMQPGHRVACPVVLAATQEAA